MKILGTLFRLLCALVVLLIAVVYLEGPLQASLTDYLKAFTPELLQSLACTPAWPLYTAGGLLLLALCCGMKLGWNILYSIATLAFFAEVAILAMGPELALPSAMRGLGWESTLRAAAISYPIPTIFIPFVCFLGSLCSSSPVRIAGTSLISCALFYGCAELLSLGIQAWQDMEEPFAPLVLRYTHNFPWLPAAASAALFVQFSIFMAIFETFSPCSCKQKVKEEEKKEADKAEESAVAAEAPATPEKKENKPAAKLPGVAPMTVKRPIVHRKSPVTPPAAAKNAETSAPEEPKAEPEQAEAPAEEPKAEPEQPEAPAEEPKAEEEQK